jgi:hypothetical protein
MYKYRYDYSHYQVYAMLRNGCPMVIAIISQYAGSTKNFNDGNDTKKKENNPDYFIAFEYVSYQIHHITILSHIA